MVTDKDDALERLFEAARSDTGPSDDLVARVLSDAARVQADAARARKPAPRRGGVRRIAEALGGWGAVSGLLAAGVTGLMVGLVLPDTLDQATGGTLSAVLGTADAGGFAGLDAIAIAGALEDGS